MGTQGTGRKRSTKKERSTAEDDALNLIAREAEARLAAKRAARAEAREIRMKELERQQKELSDDDERMSVGSRGSVRVEDRDYLEKGSRAASALTAGTLTSLGGTSSRRGSGETALTVDAETSLREIKEIHELKDQIQDVELKYAQNLKEAKDALAEVEEKYRKAMVSNAQLDNEKNNLMYQVDTLKDSLMELEELLSESQRGHEDKVKELEREKHAHSVLQFQFNEMKETLKQSEELLNEIRQLRLKQEGFVREISDLQETVEWKDKKIGALERQKEYTDAIRIERDELREEVVKLKDILKKHGVILGPDLNANGDMSEADVERSSIADPAFQSAADSQTSPSEGNSVLGNTEETHMRSIGEEELDPEQHGEMLEETKVNHLSSDALCDTAGVSTLETPREDQPTEEKECIVTEEHNDEERGLNKDLNVGFNECSGTEPKDTFTCSSGLQEIAKSSEEDVQETPEGEYSGEKETKSIRVDTHTSNVRESYNISEEQDNKQQDFAENRLESTVSCHQQKVAQDVSEESSPVDSVPAVSNTEPQQEPENAEDAENEEEEVSSKSQAHGGTSSGKKKRKKRRGRKKETHKDTNQPKEADKEKDKTQKKIESITDNVTAPEPSIDGLVTETLKESKMDQTENEQDRQETEEVDGVEAVKPIETFVHSEESRMEKVTDEPDKAQNLDIVTISETFSPTETLKKVRLDHVVDEQNKETETVEREEAVETLKEDRTDPQKDEQDKEENLEIETIQRVEALETTETCSHIETHEEPRRDQVTDEPDQEQILDTVVEAVTMTETFSPAETLKEVRLDHVVDEQDEQKKEAELIETVEAVETLKKDRPDPQKNEQDKEQNPEIETIQAVEALKTTETCSDIETQEEPGTDQVTDEPDQAQILDTDRVIEAVTMTETFSPAETLKEEILNHVMDEQNQEAEMIETVEAVETVEENRTEPQKEKQDKEQKLEIETIQTVEAVESVEEDRTDPQMDKQDEEQNLGAEEVGEMESAASSVPEDNLSAPDLTDNSKVVENTGRKIRVSGVDNSKSGTSDNSIHTELVTVGVAEEATGLTDEMKLECETNNSGSTFERTGEGNPDTEPHVPSNDVIATESTNHSEDDTLVSLSSTDGFCYGLNSELSQATAAQIKVPEPGPKEETVEAHEEGGAELESERTEKEELNKDLKEAEGLVDPDNSDCCNSPTFIKNSESFDSEKSPEMAEQAEQRDDEGQTSECDDQINNKIINIDILDTPDTPEGTTETGYSVKQDPSPEESAISQDGEHKNHQNDQQSSPELCPVEEQSHELSKDEPGDSDSSQPNLQDCEEDDEDEEGQSFDFDDLDVEAAVATNPPMSLKPIEDESNPGSLGLCQSNAGANENAGDEPVRNNDEECMIDEGNQVDTQETEEASSENVNVCENRGDTPEVLLAGKALVGELGGVAENQAASSPVEEGLMKREPQAEASVLPKSADQVASDREPPQSRKDTKKKDKKGKAKSKEDCKMS